MGQGSKCLTPLALDLRVHSCSAGSGYPWIIASYFLVLQRSKSSSMSDSDNQTTCVPSHSPPSSDDEISLLPSGSRSKGSNKFSAAQTATLTAHYMKSTKVQTLGAI